MIRGPWRRTWLAGSALAVEVLCECDSYSLIFVYRGSLLAETIGGAEAREFLAGFGYPRDAGLTGCIEELKARIVPPAAFPHEIGVFLGYPLCDVAGFIDAPHKQCALRGEWKVYGDEEKASKLFACFSRCRELIYERFIREGSLADLVA